MQLSPIGSSTYLRDEIIGEHPERTRNLYDRKHLIVVAALRRRFSAGDCPVQQRGPEKGAE